MPAHSRSNNGVASLAYVAGHPRLSWVGKVEDVGGRDKPSHDGISMVKADSRPDRAYMSIARPVRAFGVWRRR